MNKSEFQEQFGPAWADITHNPAFFAALQLVSADKLRAMALITDEQIEANGKTILADFRGHLQLENALIELAVVETESGFDLPPETYSSPGENTPVPSGDSDSRYFPPQPIQTKPRKQTRKKK